MHLDLYLCKKKTRPRRGLWREGLDDRQTSTQPYRESAELTALEDSGRRPSKRPAREDFLVTGGIVGAEKNSSSPKDDRARGPPPNRRGFTKESFSTRLG
jgi:hypothetical protein